MEVTQTSVWDINITGDNVSGETPGSISGVSAHLENSNDLCGFDITGSAPAIFDENTQQLAVTGGSLILSNVFGCFGNANYTTFEATYQLADIDTVAITN